MTNQDTKGISKTSRKVSSRTTSSRQNGGEEKGDQENGDEDSEKVMEIKKREKDGKRKRSRTEK